MINTTPAQALKDLGGFLAQTDRDYEFVLFDMPGTLNTKGIPDTISAIDHVFVPMRADKMVMESTINFAKAVQDQLVACADKKTKGVRLFWSMIDRRERTSLYDQYDKVIDIFELSRMRVHIPFRLRFNREISVGGGPVSRSTVFPADQSFAAETCLDELAAEILSIINKEGYGGR